MKGIILKGSKYHYERAWPKSVRAIAPTNKFRMALNIYAGAKESEIARPQSAQVILKHVKGG